MAQNPYEIVTVSPEKYGLTAGRITAKSLSDSAGLDSQVVGAVSASILKEQFAPSPLLSKIPIKPCKSSSISLDIMSPTEEKLTVAVGLTSSGNVGVNGASFTITVTNKSVAKFATYMLSTGHQFKVQSTAPAPHNVGVAGTQVTAIASDTRGIPASVFRAGARFTQVSSLVGEGATYAAGEHGYPTFSVTNGIANYRTDSSITDIATYVRPNERGMSYLGAVDTRTGKQTDFLVTDKEMALIRAGMKARHLNAIFAEAPTNSNFIDSGGQLQEHGGLLSQMRAGPNYIAGETLNWEVIIRKIQNLFATTVNPTASKKVILYTGIGGYESFQEYAANRYNGLSNAVRRINEPAFLEKVASDFTSTNTYKQSFFITAIEIIANTTVYLVCDPIFDSPLFQNNSDSNRHRGLLKNSYKVVGLTMSDDPDVSTFADNDVYGVTYQYNSPPYGLIQRQKGLNAMGGDYDVASFEAGVHYSINGSIGILFNQLSFHILAEVL